MALFTRSDYLSLFKSNRIRKWFKDVPPMNIYGRSRDAYEKQKVIKTLVFALSRLKNTTVITPTDTLPR